MYLRAILLTLMLSLASNSFGASGSERLRLLLDTSTKALQSGDDDKARGMKVELAYREHFETDGFATNITMRSSADIGAIFKAIRHVLLITRDEQYVTKLESVVNELRKRNAFSEVHKEDLFTIYVFLRDFTGAERVANELAKRPTMPAFAAGDHPADKPAAWKFQSDGLVASLQTIDLYRDWQVVAISHPNCHFSRQAMLAIRGDIELWNRLKGRVVWVTPQDTNTDFATIRSWNQKYPDMEIQMVHKSAVWKLPGFSATPIFYFLSKGTLVYTATGWPKDGNISQLHEGFRRIGLSLAD
jgi:hypothetical protein